MEKPKDFEKLSQTAAPVVYGRTFSDIPYSKEIAEICQADSLINDAYRVTNRLIAPYIEARFKSLTNLIKQSGIKNIIELASGLSQRGLIMVENKSINYAETDLHDMIRWKQEIITTLLNHRNKHIPSNLHFYEMNALDKENFKAIVAKFPPGHVAIGCEGFLAHLTREERSKLGQIIKEILTERGGVWITPDIFTCAQLQNLLTGKSEQKVTAEVTKKTGRNYNDNAFDDMEDAKQFFNDLGFEYTICTLGEAAGELASAKIGLDKENVKNQLELNVWELKVKK